MYCFLYPRTKCIMLNADISFWDWRQYETIAYIISLSWIRFISIKHKSKWMHFELSTHWRSRVLSRPSTSLKIMQDIRDLMNEARFLMKNLLSGCLGTGLFRSSSVADPDLELRRRGGGGRGGFFVACLAESLPQDPPMIIVLLLTLFGNHLLSLTFAGVQKRRWRFGESWKTARMYSASKESNGRT